MPDPNKPRYVKGVLIVKLTPEGITKLRTPIPEKGSDLKVTEFGLASLDKALEKFNVIAVHRLYVTREGSSGLFEIRMPPETNLSEVTDLLRGNRHVEDVDLNYLAEASGF